MENTTALLLVSLVSQLGNPNFECIPKHDVEFLEEIKSFPVVKYIMSEAMIAFYKKIQNDPALQKQLYYTKEVSDVADIAQGLGFKVTAGEILKSQAGRLLALYEIDLGDFQEAVSGRRPKNGAQWGRGAKGYLERPGFWLLELEAFEANSILEKELKLFLSRALNDANFKKRLVATQSFEDLAQFAHECGFSFSGTSLLLLQARRILNMSLEEAERIAHGAGADVP